MKKILYISIVAMILISGCHSSKDSSFRPDYDFSNINQVAIVSIEGAVQSQAAKNQIADFFMLELLKKGYAPMERSQVKAILNQQELESATLNSPEGAIEVGNILNVPAVVMINIPHFGENITMTAKMIDVEDASILWMGSGSGKRGRSFTSYLSFGFNKQEEGGLGSEDSLLTGGVLGSTEGQALTPQEAQKTKSIIKSICKTLPTRSVALW